MLPGQACDLLSANHLREFLNYVYTHEIQARVSRIDLAFDHSALSPEAFINAFDGGKVRTLAKRKTLVEYTERFAEREDGVTGT